MKIGLYADPHICTMSSIIRGRNEEFSVRLDNTIKSFDWMNKLFKDKEVDMTVCLGDLTDSSTLNAEELTALSKCGLDNHIMLVGNHDRYSKNGKINVLNTYSNSIYEPRVDDYDDFSILYLPYGPEILDLKTLIGDRDPKRMVVFSHNDIKGIYYGNFEMKEGYDFADIMKTSAIFINGHIHTGKELIKDRIYNLGTMMGLNFNCVGAEWNPSVAVLDTDTMKITKFVNPFGFVFYKKEFTDIRKAVDFVNRLDPKACNIVQLKVQMNHIELARELLDSNPSILFSRVLVLSTDKGISKQSKLSLELSKSDTPYDSFRYFIDFKVEDTDKLKKLKDEINLLEKGEFSD